MKRSNFDTAKVLPILNEFAIINIRELKFGLSGLSLSIQWDKYAATKEME